MSNKFADLGFEPVETIDSFEPAFMRTLAFEGGNTVDHAGPTNLGVTQDTYNNWRKSQGLPTKSVKDIEPQEAKELYRKEYFEKPGFSKLPANVAGVLFDFGVNAGTPRAAMALQKAVGASPDGVIGPKTLKAVDDFVNRKGEQPLLQSIIDQRSQHIDSLIQKNPAKYKKYENGWKNRINAIKSEFKLSDLNPLAVSEASASEIPQGDFADLGFEEAAAPVTQENDFTDLGFEPEQPKEFSGADKYREFVKPRLAAQDEGFLKGLVGIEKKDESLSKDHPLESAIGEGFGQLIGLVAVGGALGKVGKTVIQEGIKKFGIKNLPKILTAARVAQTGTTFGAKGAVDAVGKASSGGEVSIEDLGKIGEDIAFGSALGLTGSIAKPLMRIPAEALFGFTTAKIQGADNTSAAVNGAVFGLFGALNRTDLNIQARKIAVGEIEKNLSNKLVELNPGLKPEKAKAQAQDFIYGSATKITGETSPDKALEKVLLAKENNLKYLDELNTRVKNFSPAKIAEGPKGITAAEPVAPVSPAPKPTQELTPQKPATPIERAAQHGEVVGIDAKSGLPVIDTSLKPVVAAQTTTPEITPKQTVALAPATENKVIAFEDKLPTDAMAILNRQFYYTTGTQIPENFWEGMTAGKLISGFEKLGLGEEIIKESNIALRKAGYKKIGNIILAEDGAVPEIQAADSNVKTPEGQEVLTPQPPDTAIAGKAPASPLHAEALKYKTTEEFVSNQGDIFKEKLSSLRSSAKEQGIELSAYGSIDRGVRLSKIEVPKKDRGQGKATKIIQDLVSLADDNGVLLKLTPTNEFGASKERLKEFYSRFGFVENNGKNKNYQVSESMYREPKTKSQLTAIYNEAHGQKVGKGKAEKPTNNLKEYVDSLPSGPINITRDEIYSKFDNALKPIAEIPQKYVKYLSASSNEVFSGKAYFIDHHINHHPTTTKENYLTIPEVLKNPDEVKQNLKEGKKGLVFIKKFDKYHVAVVNLDVENGKIILHKTFFTQTKKPYKKSPLVELEGEGGNSSISRAVKPPAESVSARPSDKNITQKNKDVNPASLKPPTVSQIKAASSPQEFEKRIEQLNKFGQANAILRRTATLKKAAGRYSPKENTVKIDEETITSNSSYMEVLGHELGHAIEKNVTGKIQQGTSGKGGFELFGEKADHAKIREELMDVTKDLVGEGTMDSKPEYYHQSTELIARFFEKMIFSPGNLKDLAPTAVDAIELQAINKPIIQEFLLAATDGIDKGTPKFALLRDMRETYQKHLGKFVGNRAYDQEMVYRAMKERGKIVLEKFINDKMKMVKDSPESLFRAAESIKISRGGKPEFGTRDFATAKTPEEEMKLILAGYEKTPMPVLEDGTAYPQYVKQRYTPEEAKQIFDSLSENGKKLIVDFTAERRDAKDFFNREVIKETYKIKSQLEGWVHHYFDDRPGSTVAGGQKFKQRIAGSRKQRTGTEGYVEDFKKAMTKALVDLEGEKVFNEFIPNMLAMVTKPLGAGQTPDAGWVEVVGNIKTGVGLPIEKRATIIDSATGERVPMKQSRYQMPKEIYERYKLWRGLIDEASTAVRIVNDLNRYWRINILFHPGTSSTNYNGGALQYSMKILTDFYREVLTGNLAMPDTQANISAMVKVLLPKGWMDAPDWVYGGDLSNFYGQFMKQKSPISAAIDTYGNNALKMFGLVERYWKKVIMTADGVADLKSLDQMTPEGLKIPTKEEQEMIAAINESVDLYGYDYDNVAAWLEAHQKSVLGQAIKPFAKYPYKYTKQVLRMVGDAFDQSIPWQDRVAKILALTTIVAAYAQFSDDRKKKQKTPVADKSLDIPPRLSTRGRVFITTDDQGRELFVRVAKYPFFNLTEAGMQFVDGNWSTGVDVLSDMLGSIGPAAAVGLMAFNYRSKYNQYEKPEVILGDNLATFLPGYRILNDVSRALDPFQRKQETFGQTFTQIIPTTDQALQEKLHGKIRTERVPIEGDVGLEPTGSRTTVDVPLENVKEDILLSLFTGIYRTRLDPKVVEAYIIRKQKNLDKKNAKE